MAEGEGGHKGRRRPPSPQAKRLMLVSAVASIGLAVVLGVVFLPILFAFEGQPRGPLYILEGETIGSETHLTVTTAIAPRPYAELGILLVNGSSRHEGALNPNVPVGPVTYADDDRDGFLSVGDRFQIQIGSGFEYVLLITLLDDPGGGGVGRYAWAT
ncbi:MAG: hypothetical protein ACE5I4_02490 [Thermoplasmata archaeon]